MAAARFRCGYCLSSQQLIGPVLEIDHIIPVSLGGSSNEENLWLACPLCNGHKAHRIDAIDPVTGVRAPLFNPRLDRWVAHFAWADNGVRIEGLTATGRVTVAALQMNDADMVAARRNWLTSGLHPPAS